MAALRQRGLEQRAATGPVAVAGPGPVDGRRALGWSVVGFVELGRRLGPSEQWRLERIEPGRRRIQPGRRRLGPRRLRRGRWWSVVGRRRLSAVSAGPA